jgi:hypothetical protein
MNATQPKCGQYHCTRLKLLRFSDGSKFTNSVTGDLYWTLEEFYLAQLKHTNLRLQLGNVGAWQGAHGEVAGMVTLREILKSSEPSGSFYEAAGAYFKAFEKERRRSECQKARQELLTLLAEMKSADAEESAKREAAATAHAEAAGFTKSSSCTGKTVWRKGMHTLHPEGANGWAVSVRGFVLSRGATVEETLSQYAARK